MGAQVGAATLSLTLAGAKARLVEILLHSLACQRFSELVSQKEGLPFTRDEGRSA